MTNRNGRTLCSIDFVIKKMTENKMTLPVKFLTHCKDGNGSVAFVKALLYLDMNALSLFDESAKSPST